MSIKTLQAQLELAAYLSTARLWCAIQFVGSGVRCVPDSFVGEMPTDSGAVVGVNEACETLERCFAHWVSASCRLARELLEISFVGPIVLETQQGEGTSSGLRARNACEQL